TPMICSSVNRRLFIRLLPDEQTLLHSGTNLGEQTTRAKTSWPGIAYTTRRFAGSTASLPLFASTTSRPGWRGALALGEVQLVADCLGSAARASVRRATLSSIALDTMSEKPSGTPSSLRCCSNSNRDVVGERSRSTHFAKKFGTSIFPAVAAATSRSNSSMDRRYIRLTGKKRSAPGVGQLRVPGGYILARASPGLAPRSLFVTISR